MRRVLITVVGPRRRANLAVPAESPIGELMDALVERCGEAPPPGVGNGHQWSVTRSDAQALPMDRSLQDCGIGDGTILYLTSSEAGSRAAGGTGPAPTVYASPRERTRAALPRRLGTVERLVAVTRALLPPERPLEPLPADREPASPAGLSLRRSPGARERASNAWRATDYRARLDALIVEPRLRRCVTIAVMSPKGGVGKTTITALLGTLLSHLRRDRIVSVDTNPDYGSLGRSLTPDHRIFVDDLLHLLENPALSVTTLDLNLGRGPHGLMVLPAPTDPARMARLDESAYLRVIRRLQDLVGVVVLDCGTGLQEPAAQAALKTSDQVLLVTDAEPATASIVAEASRTLAHAPGPLVLTVNKMPRSGARLDIDALADRVRRTYGLVTIPAHAAAASRLAAGAFDWSDAPESWGVAVRELAAVLAAGWRDLGITG